MTDLSGSVVDLFVAAGWHPGRRVAVPSTVPADHVAASILAEFGGLIVNPYLRAGEECAPSNITFQTHGRDDAATGVWGALLRTVLVGIAEVHNGHGELYVAADGRCFGRSLIHDAFYFEGASFPIAAERMLLGRRAKPMLRPDQSVVTLYGFQYTPGSPETYRYE